jgi:hypothetical protein
MTRSERVIILKACINPLVAWRLASAWVIDRLPMRYRVAIAQRAAANCAAKRREQGAAND